MPYFAYEARSKDGRLVRSTIFAPGRTDLINTLHGQGLAIVSIKEASAVANRHFRRLHKGVKPKDMISFVKEISILLENGVTITDSLEVLTAQLESTDLINTIKLVKVDLESGSTLRDSMRKFPHIFSPLWVDMIEAGEVSGQLPFVLRQIASIIRTSEEIKKKTINALIYPILLITVAFASISVFVFKILPVFEDLFSSFGSELPPYTMLILNASSEIRRRFPIVIIVGFIVYIMVKRFLSTSVGRRASENILMALPAVGGLYLAVTLGRFASTLAVLLKSGIPIIRAIEVAIKTSGSLTFSDKIEDAKNKVVSGMPFSEAMQLTGLFPPIAAQLIVVAEKTGNYSGMLEELSLYYDEVIDVAISRFTALVSPVLLIIMAIGVGSVLIAMFLPIFKLSSLGA